MTPDELAAYRRDGYLVRRAVLAPEEVASLRAAAEDVVARLVARATGEGERQADGHRFESVGDVHVQWEWREGSQEVRLVEPVAELDERLAALWRDERLAGPAADALGAPDVGPFTSKMNLKRAAEGSEFPWHQDLPYWWCAVGADAFDTVTAMVLLDDATAGNGALRVLPGSHGAPAPRDPADPKGLLADPAAVDASAEVVLEVPAGSVVWFGPLLLHRSSPNRSGGDRRAVLLTWQPAGRVRYTDVPFVGERVAELP